MTNVEEIAKGLSEAQRRAVLRFRKSTRGNNLVCPPYRDCGRMSLSLQEAGILNGRSFATPLGKAVRKHLMENDCG